MKNGFGLIGILITVAIIALLMWGGNGLYSGYFKQEESVIQNDLNTIKAADDLKKSLESKNQETQEEINK